MLQRRIPQGFGLSSTGAPTKAEELRVPRARTLRLDDRTNKVSGWLDRPVVVGRHSQLSKAVGSKDRFVGLNHENQHPNT